MFSQIRPALVLLVLLTVVTGLVYPLAMTGLAGLIFPRQAQGSLTIRDGKVIGSSLLGQDFAADKYFHPRPSATVAPDPKDASKTVPSPYNAQNSGASNYGPTAKALIDRVKDSAAKLQGENPGQPVPQDLLTTSASGLDPDISLEAARFQIPRVAKARGLSSGQLSDLVTRHTEGRELGLFGDPRVNVLELNLALDSLPKA